MTCLPGRVHYWIIETSQEAAEAGRVGASKGICKHCEKVREFENSIPDSAHNFYAGRVEDG
jgi:hypothetical protein|tara:strand:+ start:319 stop:501 length:183 start_codon:yes stop_codon:yes gene_type:complete